jgi:hypothetical protein
MNIFAVQDKMKANIENIKGLNLAVVKLTTVQVTNLPLYHKIRKIGMICSVKPVLTEDLCGAKGRLFNSMLYVQNIRLTKGQGYSYETNISRQRGCYIKTTAARVQLKKNSGRGSEGA